MPKLEVGYILHCLIWCSAQKFGQLHAESHNVFRKGFFRPCDIPNFEPKLLHQQERLKEEQRSWTLLTYYRALLVSWWWVVWNRCMVCQNSSDIHHAQVFDWTKVNWCIRRQYKSLCKWNIVCDPNCRDEWQPHGVSHIGWHRLLMTYLWHEIL